MNPGVQLRGDMLVLVDENAAQSFDGERVLTGLDEFAQLADLVQGKHAPTGVDQLLELRFHKERKYAGCLRETRLKAGGRFLVAQDRAEPALRLGDRHLLAAGVVLDLVAAYL